MSPKDVFLAYVQAYNAMNVDRMLELFEDTCVFENVSAGNVTVRTESKAALELIARRSAEAFQSREQKILSITESQDRLAAEIDYQALLRSSLSPTMPAGTRLHLRGVSVFEFAAGKIKRLTDYA